MLLIASIGSRPGADDVIVLKRELIHAQTLMDKLTQEREREKEVLQEDYTRLEERNKR